MDTEQNNIENKQSEEISTDISCKVSEEFSMDFTGQSDLVDKQESMDTDVDIDVDIYYDEDDENEEEEEETGSELEEMNYNINIKVDANLLEENAGSQAQCDKEIKAESPTNTDLQHKDYLDETTDNLNRESNSDEETQSEVKEYNYEERCTVGDTETEFGIKFDLEDVEDIELEEAEELACDFVDGNFKVKLEVEEEERQCIFSIGPNDNESAREESESLEFLHSEINKQSEINSCADSKDSVQNEETLEFETCDQSSGTKDENTNYPFDLKQIDNMAKEVETEKPAEEDNIWEMEYDVDTECSIENMNDYLNKAQELPSQNSDNFDTKGDNKIEFALEFDEDSSLENAKLYVAAGNTVDDQFKDESESSSDMLFYEEKRNIAQVEDDLDSDETISVEDDTENNEELKDQTITVEINKTGDKAYQAEDSRKDETDKKEKQPEQKVAKRSSRDESLEYTVEHTEFLEVGMLGFVMMERTDHAEVDQDIEELPALQIQESPSFYTAKHPHFEYESERTSVGNEKKNVLSRKKKKVLTVDIEEVESSDSNLSPSTVASDASVETVRENVPELTDNESESFKFGMLASSSARELEDMDNVEKEREDVDTSVQCSLKELDFKATSSVKDAGRDYASPSGSDGSMIINAALSEDEDYHRIMSRTPELDFESDLGDSLDLVPGSDLEESQEWISEEGKHGGCCDPAIRVVEQCM